MTQPHPTHSQRFRQASRSAARRSRPLLFWLPAAALLYACSSESTEPTAASTPPTLALTRITPVGAPAWVPGGSCVERGHDSDGSLAVQVRVTDAELRAPGACGSRSACGHLQFSVAGAEFSQSARGSSVSHTFAMAQAPVGASYTFSVTLADDDGVALQDSDGNDLTISEDVELSAPGGCGGEPLPQDAGSDAATDAGSDAATDAGSDAATDAGSDADASS